jgi:hypothetical protein
MASYTLGKDLACRVSENKLCTKKCGPRRVKMNDRRQFHNGKLHNSTFCLICVLFTRLQKVRLENIHGQGNRQELEGQEMLTIFSNGLRASRGVGWGETESTWYVGQYLAYCPSPGWSMMSVELSVEWELAGETEVLGENLPRCDFLRYKSHMSWPRIEPGPPRR